MNLGLWLPPHLAHKTAPFFLNLLKTSLLYKKKTPCWKSFSKGEDFFCHPLGIAGGIDKKGNCLKAWEVLGAGFLEVGTITKEAQTLFSFPYIERNRSQKALWNRMGFPSEGVDLIIKRLEKLCLQVPLWANIGKNRKTPLKDAYKDYVHCMQKLNPFVQGFVLNLSSPNTYDLRKLLEPEFLEVFLDKILQETKSSGKTILLKVSPDITHEKLKEILDSSLKLDGWILTNTTVSSDEIKKELGFKIEGGGISGKPLAEKAKQSLKWSVEHLGEKKKEKLIVSSGGVLTVEDVLERLSLGADLIQVYSALVFEGPFFFKKAIRQLKKRVCA